MGVAKRPVAIITTAAVAMAVFTPGSAGAAPTPAKTVAVGSQNIIVLLKNQHSSVPNTRPNQGRRTSLLHDDQRSVVTRAQHFGGRNIHEFSTINAISLTADSATVSQLQADPAVAAVVADLTITAPAIAPADASADTVGTSTTKACSTNPKKPILEPEALQTMHVASASGTPEAQAYTRGAGVTVGFIADGVDPNNPGFIRNGKSVFTDYQDFGGDGPGAPTGGGEAFGDASAVAAQPNHTYNVNDYVNESHALPKGCYIKISGVAPAANLVGLNVFGQTHTSSASNFIRAIEYAVDVDHVDVLNESFGGNPYPDDSTDPISLADDAAVQAGVTVVASTGDAGITNTIGSPASDPNVIAAGATTIYRGIAQTSDGGFPLPGVKGWVSDNISPLSSGGFTQTGKVADLVAPGDSGWALCSVNVAVYDECTNSKNTPTGSPIQLFGGTSQSSPLIAGVAALVISAYEKSHPGAGRPSPALVKRLLTSSAQDLGHPAQLQGSGEVDALAAVRAAINAPGRRSRAAAGTSLLRQQTQLDLTGKSGSVVSAKVSIRNDSAHAQRVTATTRSLTTVVARRTGTINFDPTKLPSFPTTDGALRYYTKVTVKVGPGVDRIDGSLAWNGAGADIIFTNLVDPSGNLESYSAPQGSGSYSHVDARYPEAGTWTMYVWGSSTFTGPIKYELDQSTFGRLGSVTPSSRVVGAGRTATFTVHEPMSTNPGDTAASVQFKTRSGLTESLPVSLRSVISARRSGLAVFHGTITGGNGRDPNFAANQSYYVDVPAGRKNLSVGIKFNGQTEPNEGYVAYLIAPDGEPLSIQSNFVLTPDGTAEDTVGGMQLYTRSPVAGRWKLVVEALTPVAGTAISQPFTGYVSVADQTVSASPSLPHSASTVLKAGRPVIAKVKVTNTGVVTRSYFSDARLSTRGAYSLASQIPGDDLQNEGVADGSLGEWLVPTRSSRITVTADATVPIGLDVQAFGGNPEVFGYGVNGHASATNAADEIGQGDWFGQAGLLGPFSGPATDGTVAYHAVVQTALFDPNVVSSTGDFWQTALIPAPAQEVATGAAAHGTTVTRNWRTSADQQATAAAAGTSITPTGPLTLAPGQSGTITVELLPSAATRGSVVSGRLDVDTLDPGVGSGDQVSTLPYTYKVG